MSRRTTLGARTLAAVTRAGTVCRPGASPAQRDRLRHLPGQGQRRYLRHTRHGAPRGWGNVTGRPTRISTPGAARRATDSASSMRRIMIARLRGRCRPRWARLAQQHGRSREHVAPPLARGPRDRGRPRSRPGRDRAGWVQADVSSRLLGSPPQLSPHPRSRNRVLVPRLRGVPRGSMWCPVHHFPGKCSLQRPVRRRPPSRLARDGRTAPRSSNRRSCFAARSPPLADKYRGRVPHGRPRSRTS